MTLSSNEKTIHELFLDQVKKSPNAVALAFEESSLTYDELNIKSNQLAHFIRGQFKSFSKDELKADILIPLYLTKGPEMIIGILAVLKSGAAYVPIDPTYPKERIEYILKETKAKILLTQRALMEGKDWEKTDLKTISIDLFEELYQNGTDANLPKNGNSSSLAYVIFTSGTTGKPKGVTIAHKNVINLLEAQENLQISQDTRMLQFASFVFDVSVWEIFSALLNGAELFIISEFIRKDAQQVLDYLESKMITIALLPPVLLSVMPYSSLENLNTLLVGGDVCSLDLMTQWSKGRNLYNAYGPTESTVLATTHRFKEGDSNLNIGKPLQGVEAFVLDKDGNILPPGSTGELYLAGKGLARGYLNQPKLTAEKFVTNPFFKTQSRFRKLYRTGDLVRQLDNGDLEYVRRIDTQVKIQGFRVELGEIESVLLNIRGILQCCVIAKTIKLSTGDSKQLIAYYVDNGKGEIHAKTIRERLSLKLPHYMLPYSFIKLEEFPTSVNGKIDKKALPKSMSRENSDFIAPRNKFESQLLRIVKELLGLDSLSCSANFFEYGGNSLLATMFIAQVRKECNIEIPIRLFLSKPVIMDLVDSLTESKNTKIVKLPKVAQIERTKENSYDLTFPQTAIWVLNEISPVSLAYNTQFAITFIGKLKIPILKRAVNELIKRHESLRSTFHSDHGKVEQKIHTSFDFKIEEISIATLNQMEKQFELAAIRARCCEEKFDISHLPLFKWSLVEIDINHYELIVVEHHFVHDGKSVTVLLKEISSIYSGLLSNEVCNLPALDIQMVDFAAWQQRYIKSDLYIEGLTYWKKKLKDSKYLSLPNDYGEPSFKSYTGECIDTAIPKNLYEKILQFARIRKTSFFIVMLSAFKVFLSKYSSETDLTIGSSVANRRMVEFEKLIGMCVNTIALRTKLNIRASFLEIMELVEDTVHEAQQYQDVPFSELVKEIVHDREINKNPIFGISFNFHDHQMPTIEWPEVNGKFKFLSNGSSKFDLSVLIMPPSIHNHESFVRLEYATNQFKRETVSKIGTLYFKLIEQLISQPERSISDFSIVSKQEEKLLLQSWNKTDADYPANVTIHEFFAQQVKKTPLATAVIFEKEKLTYDELNKNSNQLARYIRQKYFEKMGDYPQPETVIPVCFGRSMEMILSMMAVLKTGAAFVAIDPNHPHERIEYILKDTAATLVLSSKVHSNSIGLTSEQIILVDLKEKLYEVMDDSDLAIQNTQSDTAFIFYNTGTTKRPNGVRTTNMALLNLANYYNNKYQGQAKNYQAALVLNYVLDFSIQQVLSSILFGNTLHLIPEELLFSSKNFNGYLELNDIEVFGITPTLFSHIMLPSFNYKKTKLRLIHIGGGYISSEHVKRFWSEESTSQLRILNSYGPAEYVTNASCSELKREMILDSISKPLPIGKPLDNTRVYVLDSNLKPVPVGVIGELLITGAGLSAEYSNHHGNTSSQFIANSYATDYDVLKGYDRLYKTGDLVRWLNDGNLEYVGRNDDQIRSHGFIFKLDEIEKELCLISGIKHAYVIQKEHEIEGKNMSYLVAYYTIEQEKESISELEILQSLSSVVLDFMTPNFLVRLDSFPMNSLGGIDSLKLPEPDFYSEQDYASPRDELKDVVVKIWKEVLGIENVGLEDNFFKLGGDSLLAIRAAYKMSSSLGYNIKVDEIFRSKSISQFFQNKKILQPDDSNLIWKF